MARLSRAYRYPGGPHPATAGPGQRTVGLGQRAAGPGHQPADLAVAALAARQHGVASYAQLAQLGLSKHAIERVA